MPQWAPTSGGEFYEAVIGLEVHVQLASAKKMFSSSTWEFGEDANRQLDITSAGYPGALPVINQEAVDLGLLLALALDCEIHAESRFERKSYFYPDLPKGFQITQHRHPLASGGQLPLRRHPHAVPLAGMHLEEDAGKLLHREAETLVDLNRAGAPLAEIVSQATMRSAEEAQDFLRSLQHLVRWLKVSSGAMERGAVRCDANISLRPKSGTQLGPRVEIKNLNSVRHLGLALEHEISRQRRLLNSGQPITSETRGFDPRQRCTLPQRNKEDSLEYRYLSEPDLPPLRADQERLHPLAKKLPKLPWQRRQRLESRWRLSAKMSRELTSSAALTQYFEDAMASLNDLPTSMARTVTNWVLNETLGALRTWREQERVAKQVASSDSLQHRDSEIPPPDRLPAAACAAVVRLVHGGELSSTAGQDLILDLLREPLGIQQKSETWVASIRRRVENRGWSQVRDAESLRTWTDSTLQAHPQQVEEFRAGKDALLGFFIGKVMTLSGGRADPQQVRQLLLEVLRKSDPEASDSAPQGGQA
ncbi:MAG: Asp-tRNA(Asn)/Glu-tRNA(Gln) amidotransferase subunit GatB [Acidobacteriota bacterium]